MSELEITRAWATVLDPTAYVPMSVDERERYLLDLVNRLFDALASDPFAPDGATEVGVRLVRGHFTGPDSLPRTVELLAKELLFDPLGRSDHDRTQRVLAVLGALAGGYAGAMRLNTLDQQEQLNRALLKANHSVKAQLRATENRFHEVFATSAVGIAITHPNGRFAEINPALAKILACEPGELAGRRLQDFFAQNTEAVNLVGLDQGDSGADRIRQRRKLIRGNGETAWVYLATSRLRDGSGNPTYHVTMVQDLSELQLLQGRLGHQLLHDALTGLANRQHFISNLEGTLEQADPSDSITLCWLGLDSFSAVNSACGHEVGDHLLQTIAKRLRSMVADERAMVARVGGDEFAVLIEDSAHTPDIPELVERINAELVEPTYIGDKGIAVGASIGAVRRVAGGTSGTELFRAADVALRNAKAIGMRQWVGYDPHRDAALRKTHLQAVELAAAWENGELDLAYLPVVRLADRHPVGVRAVLSWNRPEIGAASDGCLELAERMGLSVPLAPWMLDQACEQLPASRLLFGAVTSAVPVQRIRLSRLQSSDADLSAAVNRAIGSTGVSPALLEIAFDTGALLDDCGDARDNLQVLADVGVTTALHTFTGGIRELALLEDSPARSVILANLAGTGRGRPVTARATARLVSDLVDSGVHIGVDQVCDDAEAAWWNDIGVHTASGLAFGEPVAADQLAERYGRQ